MLTIVPDTYPAGLGEPLNIVIAGNSDAAVLVDSKDDGGFLNWALSLNFSGNCLGAVNSGGQEANLGDGEGVGAAHLASRDLLSRSYRWRTLTLHHPPANSPPAGRNSRKLR